MLALNKVLQKAGKETRYCKVKYLSSGVVFKVVSTHFTKSDNAKLIVFPLSNIFIWAAKMIDQVISRVEILKHWQHFKMHEISLKKYLEEERIKFLKYKVKSSTSIQLKSLLY